MPYAEYFDTHHWADVAVVTKHCETCRQAVEVVMDRDGQRITEPFPVRHKCYPEIGYKARFKVSV